MSKERRERKRFQAAKKLGTAGYTPNHPPGRSSFSFDFKPGEKEKFFKKSVADDRGADTPVPGS